MTMHDLHQLTRGVKNTDTMRKTRMTSSGINQIGKAKLLDSPKPLKRPRLHHLPQRSLQLPVREFHEVMKRVTYALIRHVISI
jgi:hypothetical protein